MYSHLCRDPRCLSYGESHPPCASKIFIKSAHSLRERPLSSWLSFSPRKSRERASIPDRDSRAPLNLMFYKCCVSLRHPSFDYSQYLLRVKLNFELPMAI